MDGEKAADVFDLLGYRARVTVPAGPTRAAVRAILQGFGPVAGEAVDDFALTADSAGRWQVRIDGEPVEVDATHEVALGQLEWRVVTAALNQRPDLFHLHASALCLPTCRTGLVLLGGSGRGKTTLTMGLMLSGFVPFGDDVALADPQTLELRPFRRAFHLAEGTWRLLEGLSGGYVPGPDEVPGYFSPPQWAEQPAPIRWVLLPEYRPRQSPELIPLSASEAASAIISQTLSLARAPRMALDAAARLAADARCYRYLCGDLAESVAAVQRLVSAGAVTSAT